MLQLQEQQNNEKIDSQADRITNGKDISLLITDIRNQKIVVEVFKSLQSIEPVTNFWLNQPQVFAATFKYEDESGKKSMAFQNAKLFNQLPQDLYVRRIQLLILKEDKIF